MPFDLQRKHFNQFLNSRNRDNKNQSNWFVKYSADWCGHCQNLQPVWDQFVNSQGHRLANRNLKVLEVLDTDLPKIEKRLGSQGVQGFPTLRVIRKNGSVVDYNMEDRSLESLQTFAERYATNQNNNKKGQNKNNRQNINKGQNKNKGQNMQNQRTQRRKQRQAGGGRSRRQRQTHRRRFLKIAKR